MLFAEKGAAMERVEEEPRFLRRPRLPEMATVPLKDMDLELSMWLRPW